MADHGVLIRQLQGRSAEHDTRLDTLEEAVPCCHVTHNANQSISNDAVTSLAFNTERYDGSGMHDISTNNSRVTFWKAGKYRVGASVEWAVSGVGDRFLSIVLNNTTYIARDRRIPTVAGEQHVDCEYEFAVGDYVEVRVYQNSGGDLDVVPSGGNSPEFWVSMISGGGGVGAANAGDGLAESGGVLSVNVDNSTVEIDADTLRVKADGITASHIAADAVGSSEIAADAVTASEIATGAVGTDELAADAVTAAKIAADAVGTSEIAADAVTSSEIAADAVGASELANDAVVNANVAAGAAIDAAKIHDGTVSNAEYGYLNGVTSAIQTQIDGKLGTAHESDTTNVHGITDTSTLYRSGGTDVAVADGGTGASTASGARTNLGIKWLGPVIAVATVDVDVTNAPSDIGGYSDPGDYLLRAQADPELVGKWYWDGAVGSALTRSSDCPAGMDSALAATVCPNEGGQLYFQFTYPATVGDGGEYWEAQNLSELFAGTFAANNVILLFTTHTGTGTTTLTTTSTQLQFINNSSGTKTLKLPASPDTGQYLIIKRIGAGTAEVNPNGGTIEGSSSTYSLASGEVLRLVCRTGTTWHTI